MQKLTVWTTPAKGKPVIKDIERFAGMDKRCVPSKEIKAVNSNMNQFQ